MANKITVTDDMSGAEVLVCPRYYGGPMVLADNEVGQCANCGQAVQFRPHAPASLSRMCLPCARPFMEAEAAEGKLEIALSTKTADEIDLFRSAAKGEG